MENKLTNSDHWFVSNLKALIGGEEYMVKMGIKKEVDRKMLENWIKKNQK